MDPIHWVPVSDRLWLHAKAHYVLAQFAAVIPETETFNTSKRYETQRKLSSLWDQPLEGAKITYTESQLIT